MCLNTSSRELRAVQIQPRGGLAFQLRKGAAAVHLCKFAKTDCCLPSMMLLWPPGLPQRTLLCQACLRCYRLLTACAVQDLNVNLWYADDGTRIGTYIGHNGAVATCDVSCAPWLCAGIRQRRCQESMAHAVSVALGCCLQSSGVFGLHTAGALAIKLCKTGSSMSARGAIFQAWAAGALEARARLWLAGQKAKE